MLTKLQWPLLQERRRANRLCLFYKALHQTAAVTIPAYALCATRAGRDGRTWLRFVPIYCRTNVYKFSYVPQTIVDWNNLPASTVNQLTVMAFRNAVVGLPAVVTPAVPMM